MSYVEVTLDTTSPVVRYDGPDRLVPPEVLEATVTVEEDLLDLEAFFVDSAGVSHAVGVDGFRIVVPTVDLVDGHGTLLIHAVDRAGNVTDHVEDIYVDQPQTLRPEVHIGPILSVIKEVGAVFDAEVRFDDS